jgi:hypothetical protein
MAVRRYLIAKMQCIVLKKVDTLVSISRQNKVFNVKNTEGSEVLDIVFYHIRHSGQIGTVVKDRRARFAPVRLFHACYFYEMASVTVCTMFMISAVN